MLDRTLGVLNGAVGDYLVRTQNALATPMTLVQGGAPVACTSAGLAAAYPTASRQLVVLVHGLMATEHEWRMADGGDFGSRLTTAHGATSLYVRYNTGLAVAEAGRQFAALLDQVVTGWPTAPTTITLIGHSMGGLVIRSACHVAAQGPTPSPWLPLVTRAFYLGTPHRGAPLERAGKLATWVLRHVPDPVTRLIGDVAALRSAGIQDLGDPRHPVPLLPTIAHHLIAGSATSDPWLATVFGDGMVSIASATDGRASAHVLGADPRVMILRGVGHAALVRHPMVYAAIAAAMAEVPT